MGGGAAEEVVLAARDPGFDVPGAFAPPSLASPSGRVFFAAAKIFFAAGGGGGRLTWESPSSSPPPRRPPLLHPVPGVHRRMRLRRRLCSSLPRLFSTRAYGVWSREVGARAE